ncbi:MAG: hypothetical protein M3387_01095, partial [Actinomycetota bacterium]|nr:hypothetical protein [Actinomycetota bacterium]
LRHTEQGRLPGRSGRGAAGPRAQQPRRPASRARRHRRRRRVPVSDAAGFITAQELIVDGGALYAQPLD